MIPKVDFQVHEVFIKAFLFAKIYKGNREKFNEDVKIFLDLYKIHENKILELIERFSGFAWTNERIPVFLIPQNPIVKYSFTKFDLEDGLPGIVQKIHADITRSFHIFIHELSHVNQRQGGFYSSAYGVVDENNVRNDDITEVAADLITFHVIRTLFNENSEYENDFYDFLENTNEKNIEKLKFFKKYKDVWDLDKNTLKYYLIHKNEEFNPQKDK